MKLKIILLAILIISNRPSYSQFIEWLKILDDYSFGNCIEKTFIGDYLVGCRYRDLGLLFDDDGNNYWEENVCLSEDNGIIYNTELPDGRFLFVDNFGNLFLTNSDGKNVDSLFNIGLGDSKYETYIYKGLRQDSILFLIGSARKHNKSGSTIQKLNLNSLNILSQQFDTVNINLDDLNYFPDGSLLKCYSNSIYPYLIKSDKDGKDLWKKFISLKFTTIKDMMIGENQCIYLTGNILDTTNQRQADGLLIKLDSSGALIWTKIYQAKHSIYPPDGYKNFNRIKSIHDNEIILAGTDGDRPIGLISDMTIMSVDSTGDIKWEIFNHVKGEGNEATDFTFNYDQDIIAIGTAAKSDYGEPERAFIMKVKRPLTTTVNSKLSDFEIFPNPATDYISINSKNNSDEMEVQILNTFGKLIYQSQIKQEIDIHSLESGQYFIRLKSKESMFTQKLTVIKVK